MTLAASCPSTRVGGFLGFLAALTACIGSGRTILLVGKGSSKGIKWGCTVILEVVASYDLWIWHSFFGMAGSNNDINVVHRSSVFSRLTECTAPHIFYEINGNPYDKGYYLADGIYPSRATFVKTVCNPADEKCKKFAKEQEAARKDVERTFGVLQSRCVIVRYLLDLGARRGCGI
jgi:hypothetical protein